MNIDNLTNDQKSRLEFIIRELHFYARRYADNRMSYVPDDFNRMTEELLQMGIILKPDQINNKNTIWATDGDEFADTSKAYSQEYGTDGKGVRQV